MWHASVSIQRPGRHRDRTDPEHIHERYAVEALRGVGGDHEWWIMRGPDVSASGITVGHLRVPVTDGEYLLVPLGIVTTDAGDSGPQRPRTR